MFAFEFSNFVILTSSLLIHFKESGGSNCRDFSFSDCGPLDFFETVDNVNSSICQQYCNEVFDKSCEFFVEDKKQLHCMLFETSFEDFNAKCNIFGGPREPTLTSCSGDPCAVRTTQKFHYLFGFNEKFRNSLKGIAIWKGHK